MGLKPLSSSLPKVTGQVFSRKYIALGRIVTQWEEIIGSELADKAHPLKIHYRKPKDKKEAPKATLEIAVSSAQASLLHYQKGLILERINQIFGDRWITDLKFSHIQSGGQEKPRPQERPLKQAAEKNLNEILVNIEDMDIRSRLKAFGEAFFKDKDGSGI